MDPVCYYVSCLSLLNCLLCSLWYEWADLLSLVCGVSFFEKKKVLFRYTYIANVKAGKPPLRYGLFLYMSSFFAKRKQELCQVKCRA